MNMSADGALVRFVLSDYLNVIKSLSLSLMRQIL